MVKDYFFDTERSTRITGSALEGLYGSTILNNREYSRPHVGPPALFENDGASDYPPCIEAHSG